jgi:hypothetical protein
MAVLWHDAHSPGITRAGDTVALENNVERQRNDDEDYHVSSLATAHECFLRLDADIVPWQRMKKARPLGPG